MGKKLWAVVLMLVLCGAAFGQEPGQEFIVISKAPKKSRVAIPSFRIDMQTARGIGLGEELAALLGKDLTGSGFFELIPRPAYLKSANLQGEEDWGAWSLLNAQGIVRGQLTELSGDQYQLTIKLLDASSQRMAIGKSYKGSRTSLRRMIHRFSDEGIEWLTGKRGGLESRLAFVSGKSGRKEIYVSDSDGFNPVQVTASYKLNLSPAWLNGGSLYYTGYDRINPDLYLLDIFTREKKLISSQRGLNISPAAGPGGKKLAAALESPGENLDVYVLNPDGSKPQRVTSHPASDLEPAWSPDGHYLAFVSDRSGSPQIYMIDLYQGPEKAGNRPVRLTMEGSYNSSPAWSPDGRYLAYCRRTGNQFDLYMIDFQSGDKRSQVQLTSTPYNEEDPTWSPDGRMLAYSSNKNGNYDIFVISIFSKEPAQITDWPSDETQPSWSPGLYEKGG